MSVVVYPRLAELLKERNLTVANWNGRSRSALALR